MSKSSGGTKTSGLQNTVSNVGRGSAISTINNIKVERDTIVGNNYNAQTVLSTFRQIPQPTISEYNAALDKLSEISMRTQAAYENERSKAERDENRAMDDDNRAAYNAAQAHMRTVDVLYSHVNSLFYDIRREVDSYYNKNK